MATVSKKEICKAIWEKLGLNSLVVDQVVQTFMDQVVDALENGKRLEFRDFGVFELRRRRARSARNPKTGQIIKVPERTTVIFKPGRLMKARVEDVIPEK